MKQQIFKSSEEAMEVVKEMEKILEVTSAVIYGLPTNKFKYLTNNFVNMVFSGVINTLNEVIVVLKIYEKQEYLGHCTQK